MAEDRPDSAKRPDDPQRRIERLRNGAERRWRQWKRALDRRIAKDRKALRERIERIRANAAALEMSAQAIEMLADFEGVILGAYNDPAPGGGHCTVGAGHLLHHGPCTQADYRAWDGITRKQVLRLLDKDVTRFEQAVRDLVDVELERHEFEGLVIITFNIGYGIGGLADSTLLRKLNAGDRRGAADEFLRWTYSGGVELPGLITRRELERRLFLTGNYS